MLRGISLVSAFSLPAFRYGSSTHSEFFRFSLSTLADKSSCTNGLPALSVLPSTAAGLNPGSSSSISLRVERVSPSFSPSSSVERMAIRLADSTSHLPVPPKMAISRGRLIVCQGLQCLAVHQRGRQCPIIFSSRKLIKVVRASVVPISPSLLTNDIQRSDICKTYGFMKIGEAVPDNVTLKDIISTLPKKVFEIDDIKAWRSVLISVVSYALGILMIAKTPWYLLPLAWAWTGTAVTGFFVVGHDCAHRSFSRNKMVEDIVGTLAFLPLIYPYEPWRFKHDKHHAKTNMLLEDTAWHPIFKEEISASPLLRKALIFGYGPLRPWMSIAHWLMWHFDLKKFKPNEVGRVKISLACVFAFIVIGWPLIIWKAGIVGWIKIWLMPWLVYHFWMSTFTMVHHTAPHIPFKASDEWNASEAQLNGTVHCNYPRWIEILCHDINVHIPHHISPRIPSYNLREAHRSLQQNWGKYLNEANWNWRLMKTIMTTCHVYNKEEYYIPFDKIAPEESQPVIFLRKSMPDYV